MTNGIVELKCYRFYPTNTECIVTAEIVKMLGEPNRIVKMQLTEGTKVPKTIEFTARGVSELKQIISNMEGAEEKVVNSVAINQLLDRATVILRWLVKPIGNCGIDMTLHEVINTLLNDIELMKGGL